MILILYNFKIVYEPEYFFTIQYSPKTNYLCYDRGLNSEITILPRIATAPKLYYSNIVISSCPINYIPYLILDVVFD